MAPSAKSHSCSSSAKQSGLFFFKSLKKKLSFNYLSFIRVFEKKTYKIKVTYAYIRVFVKSIRDLKF